MKKILAVLIALMLTALCCFAAVAEGTIDFSGYTLEELLTIRDDLTDEIASPPWRGKDGAGHRPIQDW